MTRYNAAALCGLLLLSLGGAPAMAAEFQSDRWKAERGTYGPDNPRKGMLKGAEALLQPRMTQDQVLVLLGEPEARENSLWRYGLGALGFGVDLSYLVIEFAADGRLKRHFVEQG
jgi:hypothetical protein